MNYAVIHLEKCKPNTYALGRHINREATPLNVDKSKAHENKILIEYKGTLNQAIDDRIKEGYKGKTAIRKDAVKAISIVLTGSHGQMMKLREQGKLNDWVKSNYEFMCTKFGRANIVSLALHMDEKTPHLHAVIAPLTSDGRLSAKEVMGNKEHLRKLQTEYAGKMQLFELQRGTLNSRATHEDVKEYYKRVNEAMSAELDVSTNILESKTAMVTRIATPLMQSVIAKQHKIEELTEKFKITNGLIKRLMVQQSNNKTFLELLTGVAKQEYTHEEIMDVLVLNNLIKNEAKIAPEIDLKPKMDRSINRNLNSPEMGL